MILSILPMAAFATNEIKVVNLVLSEEPKAGKLPSSDITPIGTDCKIYAKPEWYDDTDGRFLEDGDTFKAGHVYTVSVWVEAKDGYKFASTSTTTDVVAQINGKTARAYKAFEYQRWAMVVVSYTFPAVESAKNVGAISVEIPTPQAGAKASFDATLTAQGAKMMAIAFDLASIYQDAIGGVKWVDKTANRSLVEGDTFIVGHEYTVSVFLEADEGYKFDTSDKNFSVTINGLEPYPVSINGKEIIGYWISYVCRDEVGAIDFYAVEPKVGEYTYYDVVAYGTKIENEATNVKFQDMSERVHYTDTSHHFIEGHYYELSFIAKANNGYFFSADENGDLDISKITVNGNPVSNAYYYSADKREIMVICVYDALKKDVSSVPVTPDSNEQVDGILKYVKVYDISEPKAGEFPDEIGVVLSQNYYIPHLVSGKIDFIWTNLTDNKEMDPQNDKFENGKEYQVQVGVTGFSNLSSIDKSTLKGYIDDEEVDWIKYTDWGILLTYNFGVLGENKKPYDEEKESEKFDCKGNSFCPQFTIFFDDAVPYDHYAHAAIDWAIVNGITNGVDKTHFGPLLSCTRGQVVTFLWRAAGCPEPKTTNNYFSDVKATDYFYKAVLWALEKNITTGASATEFLPRATCSSAHILTFLYRAAEVGSDGWYEEAKTWAKENGYLGGTGLSVNPQEECPRAAVVTFLYRFTYN